MNEPATPSSDELLRQHAWLRRVAASLVVDAASADDVAQQTLLAALERPPVDGVAPRAWLATVVRNLARRFGASERRRVVHEQAAASHERLPATDEVVARAALQTEVATAVLALAEPYRTALLLRFFEELPPRAIAKRTGAPVETVRTRVKRGLELLRAELVRRRGAAGSTTSSWAVALVGLLDPGLRRAARRALLAKAAGAGVIGVLAMATKVKLAAAALVLAAGTFTVVKLCESPKLPPHESVARATRGEPELAAPATAAPKEPASPAEATRTAEIPVRTPTPAASGDAKRAVAGCAVIEGTVKNPDGSLSEGACVFLREMSQSQWMATLGSLCGNLQSIALDEPKQPDPRRSVTGADGAFSFEAVEAHVSYLVVAVHPDVGMAVAPGVEASGGAGASRDAAPLVITLVGGVVLLGSLTDEQGMAIPGAALHPVEREQGDGLTDIPVGGDGRFRSIALPFKQFSLRAQAPGFIEQETGSFTIPDGEREHAVNIRLARATKLHGRLIASNGTLGDLAAMQERLAVAASSNDPRALFASVRAFKSRGTIRGAAGDYEIAPDGGDARFVSVWGRGRLLGVAEVVTAGVGPDVVVDLARAPKLARGTLLFAVTDARDGSPVAKFHARLVYDPFGSDEATWDDHPRKQDGAAGRLAVDGVDAGDYLLSLRANGFASLFRRIHFTPADPPVAVAIALQPATAELGGLVVDREMHPVSGVDVRLCDLHGEAVLPDDGSYRLTGGDGAFAFASIAEGDYLLVAGKEGFGVAAVRATTRAAASGTGTTTDRLQVITLTSGIPVVLEPKRNGVDARGPFMYRVRNAQGALVVDDVLPWLLTTSGGGKLVELIPGDYSVEVFCPGLATTHANFSVPRDGQVEIELPDPWGAGDGAAH